MTSASPAARERIRAVVEETTAYYDGAADEIYRDIWGENIHIGTFENPGDTLEIAMRRSNERIAEGVGWSAEDEVLDVGCGYGGMARFLARTFGCRVAATNISERELEQGRLMTEEAALGDRVRFEYADFHELPYAANRFGYYVSQEAFLHAADKERVLEEARRVLAPDGRLVFTDLLVRRDISDEDRARIYARVKSPDMWDFADYERALAAVGFVTEKAEDWSSNVAPTYAFVRGELERRRSEFEARIGREIVDQTSAALEFWVDAALNGKIGWGYYVARKPSGA